jgi:hypothetical protein
MDIFKLCIWHARGTKRHHADQRNILFWVIMGFKVKLIRIVIIMNKSPYNMSETRREGNRLRILRKMWLERTTVWKSTMGRNSFTNNFNEPTAKRQWWHNFQQSPEALTISPKFLGTHKFIQFFSFDLQNWNFILMSLNYNFFFFFFLKKI